MDQFLSVLIIGMLIGYFGHNIGTLVANVFKGDDKSKEVDKK